MSEQHPYPYTIIEAVAKAIHVKNEHYSGLPTGKDWEHIGPIDKELLEETADAALQALWDASRVEDHNLATLPQGTILEWHDGAIVRMSGSFPYQVAYGREVLKPYAHVIYWGNHDR